MTDRNIQDHLKTPEERAAYIQAAAEEGAPDAIPRRGLAGGANTSWAKMSWQPEIKIEPHDDME